MLNQSAPSALGAKPGRPARSDRSQDSFALIKDIFSRPARENVAVEGSVVYLVNLVNLLRGRTDANANAYPEKGESKYTSSLKQWRPGVGTGFCVVFGNFWLIFTVFWCICVFLCTCMSLSVYLLLEKCTYSNSKFTFFGVSTPIGGVCDWKAVNLWM